MKVSFGDIVGAFLDRIYQPIAQQITHMSQQITDLTTAVTNLTATVNVAIANEQSLKQKLDAALAANVTLTQQLATAQANQADPADAAAAAALTSTVTSLNQSLSDANAATAPTN